jgi:DNA-binding NarL/FixJ family response regulator
MRVEQGRDGDGSPMAPLASRNGHESPTNSGADHDWRRDSVTVVLGRFDQVLSIALPVLLRVDCRLRILEGGLADAALGVALRRWEPHVAILGERAEPAVAEHLQSVHPETRVLVLAHDPTLGHGMRLLAAGANCVAWSAPDVDFVATVHLTAQGHRFFAAASGERVERRYPVDAEVLTGREKEVLVLLAKNASYSEIAAVLHMAVRTAETHAASIRQKLHVQDKRDLIGMPIPH